MNSKRDHVKHLGLAMAAKEITSLHPSVSGLYQVYINKSLVTCLTMKTVGEI